MRQGCYSDELAAAAKMEERVSFYRTTDPEIARLFQIDTAAKLPCLILLTKEEEQFTLYGTCLHPSYIGFQYHNFDLLFVHICLLLGCI